MTAASSTIFGATGPDRAHILREHGVAREVIKLRADTEKVLGGGVQVISIPNGVTGDIPDLTPTGLSIVLNFDGAAHPVHLPDGTDGMVKRIVNGSNAQGATDWVYVTCSNNLGNDAYDLSVGMAVTLAWVSSLGGWVAVDFSANVNQGWD